MFYEAVLITTHLYQFRITLIKIHTGADQHMKPKHRLVLNRAAKHFMLSFPFNFPVHDRCLHSRKSAETLFSLHAPTDGR